MAELTVTVPEAARALGIHPDTLRALIADGEFPVLRIRRRILISRAELARWVEQHSTTATSPL